MAPKVEKRDGFDEDVGGKFERVDLVVEDFFGKGQRLYLYNGSHTNQCA